MAFSDARNERERATGDTSGRSSGGGGDRAKAAERRNQEAMTKSHADRNRKTHRSPFSSMQHQVADAGYISNPYPGYRGSTGTRNPSTRPEPAPMRTERGFVPGEKPKTKSIWDKFFGFGRRVSKAVPSYELTAHNISVLSGLTPGPAMPAKIAGMIAGIGPQFEKYTGMVNAPGDWDSSEPFRSSLPDFASIFYNRAPR